MTETIAYKSLGQVREEYARHCLAISRRTKCKLTWALSTALSLQGIEVPQGLKCSKKNQQIAVVKNANSRYHLAGIQFVTWCKPLETVIAEGIGSGNGINGPLNGTIRAHYFDNELLCASPVCTWAMAATRLSLAELVVLGDSMMRRDHRLNKATLLDFIAYLQRMQNWSRKSHVRQFRGYDMCQRAVRLMCENTDSSQETRTRLTLMRHRLDCPAVNYPLQIRGQQFYLDLAYPEFRVCVEYDGQFHATQWMNDSRRRRLIENAQWQYIQVTSDDLRDEKAQRQLACRVAGAIERNTGRRIGDVCCGLTGTFDASGRVTFRRDTCARKSDNKRDFKNDDINNRSLGSKVNRRTRESDIDDTRALRFQSCRTRHVRSSDLLWIPPLTDRMLSDMRYLRSQPRLLLRRE